MLLEIHLGDAYRKAVFLFALSHLITDCSIQEVALLEAGRKFSGCFSA